MGWRAVVVQRTKVKGIQGSGSSQLLPLQ